MSKNITEEGKKEEPFNSKAKAKPIDYEKEFNDLLEMISDLGLQMQNVARNTRMRLRPPQQAT